ncbi:MAG: response regulator [Patescibacteria group bacterium]|nr:response regulator [Patescibacteria group bacterium]
MNRIFIIEDDINILYGLRDIFSSNDYDVEISDSNEELDDLINNIKKFKPDVIILDIVLPKLDGAEIIKNIKSDELINSAEIFIFTDLSDEDGRSRSVGLGANYYFMKNEFDIYTFSNKVMRVMSRNKDEFEDSDNLEDAEDIVMD